MHPTEDPIYGSLWDTYVDHYINREMWERFHLSLTDMLELPRYMVDDLLHKSIEASKRKNHAVNTELNKLQGVGKDLDDNI